MTIKVQIAAAPTADRYDVRIISRNWMTVYSDPPLVDARAKAQALGDVIECPVEGPET